VILWILIIISAAILFFLLLIYANRMMNRGKRKIHLENGIHENQYIQIGGIGQYVRINGSDVNNPIVVFIHGGPGSPLNFLSYYYQPYLEEEYTFICLEQRGSGRTYYKNTGIIQEELSVELLLQDLDELVDYALKRFDKEKVIIMGQSWGTVLGSKYVLQNPEKVAAYIGVGQVINFLEGNIQSARLALIPAQKNEKNREVHTLNYILDDLEKSNSVLKFSFNKLLEMMQTTQRYLKNSAEMSDLRQLWIGLVSPDFGWTDIKWFLKISNTSKLNGLQSSLIQYLYYEFDIRDLGNHYSVPIYFIQGESDCRTPTQMAADYMEDIQAPAKGLIIINGAGHTPFLDDRIQFRDAINTVLQNINEGCR